MTMNYFNENIEKFEINSDFRIKELSKIIIEDKFNDFPFVIFTKRCSSTQKLLLNNFEDFEENLIFITDEQDDGIGRKLNKWDSPIGCLMSSILLNIDNKILNISKFIVALALIKTIKSFDKLDARIKWPNDIYYNKNKLGGIICNSYSNILNTKLITGFGININNNYPTICLNQILTEKIDSYNFYAVFLQKFIFLISQYLINESDIINEINNFLICEEEVNFYSDKNEKKLKKIKIIGIDQNGNLKALNINKLEEITISANFYTYDIINNLIKPI